jgi:hypothetical protein
MELHAVQRDGREELELLDVVHLALHLGELDLLDGVLDRLASVMKVAQDVRERRAVALHRHGELVPRLCVAKYGPSARRCSTYLHNQHQVLELDELFGVEIVGAVLGGLGEGDKTCAL